MKLLSVQLFTFTVLLTYGWISPGACTCVPGRSSTVHASSSQDTLHLQPQAIANEYVSALSLTSWSMELGGWIAAHQYKGVVDTFHEVESYQWPYEKYCFKTRIETSGCVAEYSFFDNGDYAVPKATLQQVVIVDAKTEHDAELRQRVWAAVVDSLSKMHGPATPVPQDELLSPFNLGGSSSESTPRFWQDGTRRIVLAEHFKWTQGVRSDFILMLSRTMALDSLVRCEQRLDAEYDPSAEICDSLRETKSLLTPFCHSPDTTHKISLGDLTKCGQFVAERERAGDLARVPLYRMALFVIAQSYVPPEPSADGQYPPEIDTLKNYGIIFEWNQLGGDWHISREPLIDVCSKYPNSRWGQMAFLVLQNAGWCLSGMCNGDQGPEVISKGDEFLSRFPKSSYTPAVLLTIAKGYETNWNVSTCDTSSTYMYDPKYRTDEKSRMKAIETYERIVAEYPGSREAEVAKVRLPRLKLRVSTGRSEYFFIYD